MTSDDAVDLFTRDDDGGWVCKTIYQNYIELESFIGKMTVSEITKQYSLEMHTFIILIFIISVKPILRHLELNVLKMCFFCINLRISFLLERSWPLQ